MFPFHSFHVNPKQDYLHSIHFHSFPFLYNHSIPFYSLPLWTPKRSLRGSFSMVTLMKPHLLHLESSPLQLMVPLKLSNDTQCYYLFFLWENSGSYGKIYHLLRCLASIRTHVHIPIQGQNNANPLSASHFEERQFINCWLFSLVHNTVDTLATTAQPLNDFEIVSFLLASLGSDYDSFVTLVTTRVDPLSIEELYGHLLAHEL